MVVVRPVPALPVTKTLYPYCTISSPTRRARNARSWPMISEEGCTCSIDLTPRSCGVQCQRSRSAGTSNMLAFTTFAAGRRERRGGFDFLAIDHYG